MGNHNSTIPNSEHILVFNELTRKYSIFPYSDDFNLVEMRGGQNFIIVGNNNITSALVLLQDYTETNASYIIDSNGMKGVYVY